LLGLLLRLILLLRLKLLCAGEWLRSRLKS
jgi:hypothetical protein